ncbi:glycosyltransferase family 2 protein [Bradyrhizobium sp. LHD-71]|uniref:glycosyltransferase family 2 protein n=1 Tax=Bradyrhizobium sp. LHD-71 TaxID=3072141 RepID=UPI00280DB0D3|nr:glycosyltransferase family 2 protein [Bradyrhizobium sp. LHD-71]MDQ8726796.1 glycosyltransferase family 2 protein [Bradyrhizobium sp. LHD-71]
MTLGADISDLSADARSSASKGLSIVVPAYNEGAGLTHLHERIAALAAKLKQTYGLASEVIYVDDGSRDDTLAVARGLKATTLDVSVISLSRNFGKEAALMAGLDHARRGGAVLFMDGDGQHPPVLVETLVRHWIEDSYDVVYTAKAHRKNEAMLLRLAVRGFYALMNFRARHKIPPDAGDFRLLSPRAAAALRQFPERNRFFKGLSSWIGFRQKRVDYDPEPRAHGQTSFSPGRLIGLSIDGLTSFSVAPLRAAIMLGALIALAAFVVGLMILWETFVDGKSVPGYASVIVGVMVLGGMQLVMLGVVGEYIGKIIYELKARPVYFVAEKTTRRAGSDEMQTDIPLADSSRTAAE